MTERTERIARLRTVAVEMDLIVREIGPKLIRLAHLREEVRVIQGELNENKGD